jgi:3-keto-5-aminohexanoate cleavage enzyme
MVRPLPVTMVAPNGARKQKRDVPQLPVSVDELVKCVLDCSQRGADGFHLHIRGPAGEHSLDEARYRELLAALRAVLPGGYFQITTEAVGRYAAEEQRALVRSLRPEAVSMAVRELFRDGAEDMVNKAFLEGCGANDVAVQFILYDEGDIAYLARLLDRRIVPASHLQILHVLGSYDVKQAGAFDAALELERRLDRQHAELPRQIDWAVCCFGEQETACLAAVRRKGGKVRIGFENNLINSNGTVALSNAERVDDLLAQLSPEEWATWVGSLSLMSCL